MEIELGTLIGSGATADVYAYDEGRVVKLYHDGYPRSSAEWEFSKTKKASDMGLPAPRVYALIERDGRHGFIMQHVLGRTQLENTLGPYLFDPAMDGIPYDEIMERSGFLERIRRTVRLMDRLHRVKADLIDTAEDAMTRGVKHNDYLDDGEKQALTGIIAMLPKGDTVCHGDPNPLNVIEGDDGDILIDWVNCVVGHPFYDIAEYVLLFRYLHLHTLLTERVQGFFLHCRDRFEETLLDEYARISGSRPDIEAWTLPMLAAKLNGSGDHAYKLRLQGEVRRLMRA